MSHAPATIGHNIGAVTLPKEDEMLADLQRRYPEIDARLKEWDSALAEYPNELSIDRPDEAAALQDLLGQIKKDRGVWMKAHAPSEKGPLNKLVKVVGNFFSKADERVDAILETWMPRYQAFLDKKAEAARVKAAEEAERQRQAQEVAREAAEKAQREQREAEERAAAARRKAEEDRLAAERADQERIEAQRRAEVAAAEEKRLADERKARDRAEKERNVTALRDIRDYMKKAEKLHDLAEADEANEAEAGMLDSLIKHGGVISVLAGPVAGSMLLDDDQRGQIEWHRTRLNELRDAQNGRFNKREQKRREKEAAAAAAREAEQAQIRKIQREKEEAAFEAARVNREREEAAAAKAREERRQHEQAARSAEDQAKAAGQEARAAGKDARAHTTEADRSANRADRIEARLEKSTDADLSRTRGDLGTTGGLARRWVRMITDEDALRAACGPLGEHFTSEALEGATFQWMRVHQDNFRSERVEPAELPGVVFVYELEARIA